MKTFNYEITREGKVFSLDSNWRGYGQRELKQYANSHGYMRVRMIRNGVRKSYLVHKLVAENFLPARPSKAHEIRHIDGNRQNNNVDNLCWGTRKENACDRDNHGRTSKGTKHSEAIKKGMQTWLKKIKSPLAK